jgi:hypothetical protein
MNAEQLIQQYDAAAITARKLVEGVWVDAKCFKEDRHHPAKDGTWVDYVIRCYDNRIDLVCMASKAEAWFAAAKFTRDRIEEIRQLKEEIAQMQDHVDMKNQDIEREMEILLDSECNEFDMEAIVTFVRDLCAYCRILTARQSALTDLCQGIKPEALNGQ